MTEPGGAEPRASSATGAGELTTVLDALIERFGSGAHEREAVLARAEYAERTGRVFEEDELYEARTASFLEWYAVERPLGDAGVSPAVVAFRGESDPGRRAALAALAASHRSLFSVEELGDHGVVLADLLGGARVRVDERRRLLGVHEGDVLEARLYGHAGRVLFGRTFGYHPAGTREAILAHAGRMRAEGATRADVVDYIASLRVRAERYKHVAPARVYEASTTEFATVVRGSR